ncbi:MAG: phosphate acyltransferase PlsX [Ruminococcaceae bacterium]|nr:phosphate acyltransferase PlsX [Oscillospiraceae bacterium]
MKIIIDAMGGDNAPLEIVKGAVLAKEKYDADIVLTGREEEILKALKSMGEASLPAGIEIVNCEEVITMEDDPATAPRRKRNSSMTVGLTMLRKGEADAMVSAGSTGALLTGATLFTKRINGIRRAALAPFVPCKGGNVLIIDCGANVECTPEYLLQFAFMGSFYVKSMLNIEAPRVGLINNGAEECKGTELQKETYKLLAKAHAEGRVNFVGNVEARDVPLGACDVAVCDGFTGNIIIKGFEGIAKFMFGEIKQVLKKNVKTMIGAALVKNDLMSLKKLMDSDEVGGTILLGISKPVIKAHGSSDAKAVCNAVRQAISIVNADIVSQINDNIDYMRIESTEAEA